MILSEKYGRYIISVMNFENIWLCKSKLSERCAFVVNSNIFLRDIAKQAWNTKDIKTSNILKLLFKNCLVSIFFTKCFMKI